MMGGLGDLLDVSCRMHHLQIRLGGRSRGQGRQRKAPVQILQHGMDLFQALMTFQLAAVPQVSQEAGVLHNGNGRHRVG